MPSKRLSLSPQGIAERFLLQILPKFTDNMPVKILNTYKEELKKNGKLRRSKLVSIQTMMMVLFAATVTGTSIEATIRHLREQQSPADYKDPSVDLPSELVLPDGKVPDPHVVRKSLKLWEPTNIRSRFRKTIREFIKEMKHSQLIELIHGKWGDDGLSAAFDLTEVKYYSKDAEEDPHTISSKGKGGAKYCHAYLTLQIICPGFRLMVDVEPIYKDSPPIGKLMTQMLKRVKRANLKLNNIYVDRGFYRAEVLQTFNEELSRRLILPAVRTKTIKKTIQNWFKNYAYSPGHKKVKIKSNTGHEQEFILIFKPKSKEEREKWRKKKKIEPGDQSLEHIDKDFLYFCINELPRQGNSMADVFDQIALEYSKRWGIETGFRVSKQVWAWTTSTSYELRYWLMWCSVIVYNLWILENLKLIDKDVYHDNPRKKKTSEEILEEIENDYNCCGLPSKEQVQKAKRRRERSKLPASQRSTKHFPSRPWQPRPIVKVRVLSSLVLTIAVRQITLWHDIEDQLVQAYYPP